MKIGAGEVCRVPFEEVALIRADGVGEGARRADRGVGRAVEVSRGGGAGEFPVSGDGPLGVAEEAHVGELGVGRLAVAGGPGSGEAAGLQGFGVGGGGEAAPAGGEVVREVEVNAVGFFGAGAHACGGGGGHAGGACPPGQWRGRVADRPDHHAFGAIGAFAGRAPETGGGGLRSEPTRVLT